MAGVMDDNFDHQSGLLMMYLADELSPRDRADLEQRLRTDTVLAAELEKLRSAQETFDGAMKALEFGQASKTSDAAAAERVNRAVRQWASARLARPKPPVRKDRIMPWWGFGLATAAGILVAVVFWGLHNRDHENSTPSQESQSYANAPEDQSTDEPPQQQVANAGPDDNQNTENTSESASALTDLTPQQQQDLLEAFGRGGADANADTNRNASLDDADVAIAALQNTDNADNVLLGADKDMVDQVQTP
jgi:hypothetical protein